MPIRMFSNIDRQNPIFGFYDIIMLNNWEALNLAYNTTINSPLLRYETYSLKK